MVRVRQGELNLYWSHGIGQAGTWPQASEFRPCVFDCRAILTWCFSVDLMDKHCGQHSLEDKLSVMERTAFKVTSLHHSRNRCYSSRSQSDLAVCPLGWRFLLYTMPFISPLKVNIFHREGDLQNHAKHFNFFFVVVLTSLQIYILWIRQNLSEVN